MEGLFMKVTSKTLKFKEKEKLLIKTLKMNLKVHFSKIKKTGEEN